MKRGKAILKRHRQSFDERRRPAKAMQYDFRKYDGSNYGQREEDV